MEDGKEDALGRVIAARVVGGLLDDDGARCGRGGAELVGDDVIDLAG
jgi:hypothetical protein